MAIIFKDGFCFFELSNKHISLIMDKRIDNIIEYVNLNNIESLTIQPNLHDVISEKNVQECLLSKISEVGFLEQMPSLSEIRLIDVEQCDIKGIYFLNKLKKLTITNSQNNPNKNVIVEFNRFSKLEELNVDWFSNGFDISENTELKTLLIRKFWPKCGDFSVMRLPNKLSKMEIVQSNIQNLMGIHSDTLESLELSFCTRLTSLRGINAISRQLNKIIVDSATHLSDYTEINHCQALQSIVFVQCGDMMSLDWVGSLPNLSHLVLDKTTVTIGEMRNILNIDRVFFTNKKYYNCKCVVSPNNGNWRYKVVEKK